MASRSLSALYAQGMKPYCAFTPRVLVTSHGTFMINITKNLRTGSSVWSAYPQPNIPISSLQSDKKADVVIIGAGITGAMAAEALALQGFKVLILERRYPLGGSTSATTALLQFEIDTPLTVLQQQIGRDRAMRAWRRSRLALESLSAKLQSLNITCHMQRHSSLYLAGNVLDAEALKKECTERSMIGIHAHYLTRNELKDRYGVRRSAALESQDNMTVNPLLLASGFLKRAIELGTEIYAPCTAAEIETSARKVYVHTKEGFTITADYLIHATGYEIPKAMKKKRHDLKSTYAIATKPGQSKSWPSDTLFWEAADPYLYMRSTHDGRVICGGEDEDFEDEEKRDRLLARKQRTLEKKLKDMFPQLDTKAEFAWCGTFGSSKTGLPTIDEIPGQKRCYAIMAFGGNGITFARIAAELLSATLSGHHDPDRDLFSF